jgi:hypothetical protein
MCNMFSRVIGFSGTPSEDLYSVRFSVPMEKWFVYFDQVHTTGIDIKLPREALAVVTIGSDTILRDYVQACWRLRQFGEGQKIEVLLVPEICRLVTKYTATFLDDIFDDEVGTLKDTSKIEKRGGLKAEDIYKVSFTNRNNKS